MNKTYPVLLGLAVLAMLVPAHADEICYTTSASTATIPDAASNLGGDIYVDNDFCQTDPVNPCDLSVWIYQESNGIPGQQRGDEVVNDVVDCIDGTVSDTDIQ
jgi:hypothetical protein